MIRKKVKNCIHRVNIWLLLFAMMFSAMLTASRHTFDLRADRDTVDTVFITDFHLIDCVIWIVAAVIVYIVFKGIMYIFASSAGLFFTHNPGGVFSDTVDSINMALYKNELDNHNPILYTLVWRFMFWIAGTFSGKNEYAGLTLFTVVQIFACAFVLSFFCFSVIVGVQ